MDLFRQTRIDISLDQLQINLRALRQQVSAGTFFCPMIKSDAYGHGDRAVAQLLHDEGIRHIGVAFIEEGVRLRGYGFEALEILVFSMFDRKGFEAIWDSHLVPVVSCWEQLHVLKEFLRDKDRRQPIHLKFNTGMNRLGFRPDEAGQVRQFCEGLPCVDVQGVCSHFLCGEDWGIESGYCEQQTKAFQPVLDAFPKVSYVHFHNSASLLASGFEGASAFGARPGIAFYGSVPTLFDKARDQRAHQFGIAEALSVHTKVVQTHKPKSGESVSYGPIFKAKVPSQVVVLPIGYGDGLHRNLSNLGEVLVRGHRAPMVGRICMDYCMVDVTEVAKKTGSEIRVFEDVVLFGQQQGQSLTILEQAEKVDTIAYEFMTSLGLRLKRHYHSKPLADLSQVKQSFV